MDKIIEKKKGIAAAFTKKALPYWFAAIMAIFVLWLVLRDNSSTLRINRDTLTINEVKSSALSHNFPIHFAFHPGSFT